MNRSSLLLVCLLITSNAIAAEKLQKKKIKDAPISSAMETKAEFGDKEYNARHIMVETEAEAKIIIAQLGLHAEFEKLAEKSKDAGSAAQGGSLGWVLPSNFDLPFANALRNLKKGEYTKEPLQSQFGWHVIKLDDVRNLNTPVKAAEVKSAEQVKSIAKELDNFVRKSKEVLTRNYKDPASAEFTDLVVSEGPDKRALCGAVNGKNSYGGYVGRKMFYVVYYKPGPMVRFNPSIWTEGQSTAEKDRNSDYAPLRESALGVIASELNLAKVYCEPSATNQLTKVE